MLKQIVIYILSNSLKLTENEGCPSITTELTDDRATVFIFFDTGIGIPFD
jgi:signal transduction histidine kinase